MIEKETLEHWGYKFSLRTIRQAQSAMSNRLCAKRIQDACDEITRTHHRSMGHSVQTGRIEYDRQARAIPCQDDEMECHKVLCDYLHIHQWGLDGGSTHKAVEILEETSKVDLFEEIKDTLGTLLRLVEKAQLASPSSGLPEDLKAQKKTNADGGLDGGGDWSECSFSLLQTAF